MSKEELIAEGVLILEQEGWLVSLAASNNASRSRLSRFAERYEAWQSKVKRFREANPDQWPAPPDNS